MKTIKLIVAVRSPLQMKKRRDAIRKTWGKVFTERGAEVFFIVSGEGARSTSERRKDVLYTPGTNTHGDLANRMCWLWRYLGGLSYTHVLVMDDDCSVNVPLFMTLGWKDVDAWGHNSGGYLSGCAVVYSKLTIEKLAYNMPKDDVVIGALLARLNIKMEHAGTPCFIRPWKPTKGKDEAGVTWGFGDPNIAIQHYVRTPEEIYENHSKLPHEDVSFVRMKCTSMTSEIYMDKDKKRVKKKLIKHKEYDLIKREAYVLGLLNSKNFNWAPKLLHHDDDIIITEYCGEPVNINNVPSDHEAQIKKILRDLHGEKIKHNDIKPSEILVKDGKIHLCDFGWASINDDFSCGQKISGKSKIHGIFNDETAIKILKNLYDKKIKKIPVSYRRNNSGSQAEAPKIKLSPDEKSIVVSGYQIYSISTQDKKIKYRNNRDKYGKIKTILLGLRGECNSLVDVGCSSGAISYSANELGYDPIFSLDHDQEYLDIINQINAKLLIHSINVKKFSFGDVLPKADVMTMGALIHWVYSCTALYGNFDKIFSYLNNSINKYLIIEWVNNDDAAIKAFKHIDHNKNMHSEEYNKTNFENSLKKNIGNIIEIKSTSPTRELYVVKKLIPLPKPLQLP